MTHSWLAMVLLTSGILLTGLLLALFTTGRRYLRPPEPDRGVSFVQTKLAAKESLDSLAPRLLEADSKERAVTGSLRSGAPPDSESRRSVLKLLHDADVSGLWRSFGTASSLVEDDPQMARARLDDLSLRMQSALERLAEAEEACRPLDHGSRG